MIALLIDQGLPRSAASRLREAGIDAVHTAEIGASTASDIELLLRAQQECRTVVTLDADFHSLLAISGASSPSVIRIRIEGLRGKELAELLVNVLSQCANELEQGAVVTVQQKRIRLRLLPLTK